MQSKQHLDQSYESFVSKSCSKDCWKPPSRAISEYCPAIPFDPPMQSGICVSYTPEQVRMVS